MTAKFSIAAFRNTLRPAFASRSVIAPFSTTAPARVATYGGKDDLGGPGGQQAPPPSPGGPEKFKRNWCVFEIFV
jgi:hypothetical protein